MDIIMLSFNQELLRRIRNTECLELPEDELLQCIGKYMIDYCVTLRVDGCPASLYDYLPQYINLTSEVGNLEEFIRWYSKSVLSELELEGITCPYLVDINANTITIANKKEYSCT